MRAVAVVELSVLRVAVALAAAGGAPVGAQDAEHPASAKAPFDAKQAGQLQQQWAEYLRVPVRFTNSVGITMVLIPPGEFLMGSTQAEVDRMVRQYPNRSIVKWFSGHAQGEVPAHRVRITRPFYMAATEVTVGQFRQFVEATGYKTDVERPETLGGRKGGFAFVPDDPASKQWYGWLRRPGFTWRNVGYKQPEDQAVFNVSWRDAAAFCHWLTKREGEKREGEAPAEPGSKGPKGAQLRPPACTYRLPTEAEWEYACRAGTTSWWFFGDDPDRFGDYGWHAGNSHNRPQPVGRKKPNAWGLYDMLGNLFEWCADWKDQRYYERSPADDPAGPNSSPSGTRVLRGGSFDGDPLIDRCAFRVQANPTIGFFHIGFRVAATIESAPDPHQRESGIRKLKQYGEWNYTILPMGQ